jgi:hypothetical protein
VHGAPWGFNQLILFRSSRGYSLAMDRERERGKGTGILGFMFRSCLLCNYLVGFNHTTSA